MRTRVLLVCACLSAAVLSAHGQESRRSSGITFVQWTDLHLFDAGALRHAEGIAEEALDNRAALHWAVIETNRLRRVEHRTIDFVVITGDFGLNNVTIDHADGTAPRCECPRPARADDGPIEPVSIGDAARELGAELVALQVPRVLLLPGESDFCREDARDLHRWAEFVSLLQKNVRERQEHRVQRRMGAQPSPSTTIGPMEIIDLTDAARFIAAAGDPRTNAGAFRSAPFRPTPIVINGITIVGLNTASFRTPPDANRHSDADAAIHHEIAAAKLRKEIDGTNVVFTHIADIPEPPAEGATVAASASAWRVTAAEDRTWSDNLAGSQDVAAIFAGHIHSARREDYPQGLAWIANRAQSKPAVLRKTWVAPPLAASGQWTATGEKTARGMLLVTVAHDAAVRVSNDPSVDVQPIWFSTLDQKTAIAGDDKLAQARASELDGALDTAAARFTDALASSDPATRATATAGLNRTRERMRSWWWQLGTIAPPIRWVALARRGERVTLLSAADNWWAVAVLLLVLGIAGVVWGLRRRTAVLLKANALTLDAPGAWLSQEILQAQEEIAWRLKREANLHQAGGRLGMFVLAAPEGLFPDVALPPLQGTDVTAVVKLAFQIKRYFSWQVQPSVALKGTTLSVFASRRFAWKSGGAWREVRTLTVTGGGPPPAPVNDDLAEQLPVAARRIAARLVGVEYSR